MRPTWSSTLWLELLGGLLIVLGALLALAAWYVAANPPDPGLGKALLKVGVNLSAIGQGIAARVSTLAAGMAVVGAILFFGAAYLVQAFRLVLAVLVVATLGVWFWLL
ncbi:MAG: hypothetical protein SFU83_01450 [Meiothermus sp.]|nr:hypothetical protein [Meiothermus sp.]